jgi:hypothetical protein
VRISANTLMKDHSQAHRVFPYSSDLVVQSVRTLKPDGRFPLVKLEPMTGIEPAYSAWEAASDRRGNLLPLSPTASISGPWRIGVDPRNIRDRLRRLPGAGVGAALLVLRRAIDRMVVYQLAARVHAALSQCPKML